MKSFLLMAIVVFTMMLNTHANAAMITLELSSNQIGVGETLQLDILASDFQNTDTFAFFLDFDTDLFKFEEGSVTSDLFFTNFFSIFEVNAYDGYMAFSFIDFIEPITTPNFVLASFTLTGLTGGTSDFNFSGAEFYQGGFFPLTVDSSSMASAQIPEPATWMLLPLVFAFMVRRVRK